MKLINKPHFFFIRVFGVAMGLGNSRIVSLAIYRVISIGANIIVDFFKLFLY